MQKMIDMKTLNFRDDSRYNTAVIETVVSLWYETHGVEQLSYKTPKQNINSASSRHRGNSHEECKS